MHPPLLRLVCKCLGELALCKFFPQDWVWSYGRAQTDLILVGRVWLNVLGRG